MPTEQTLYPEKTLIYQICKFLSDKKRKITGLGGPLSFKLKEFEGFFEVAKGATNEEKIMSLYNALSILNHESFGPALDRNVITILNMPNKENFINSFNNNDSIVIKYLSEDIDDYEEELKTRTQVAIRNLGLAEIIPLPSGGVKIILGNKKMNIGKSKINNFNLSANIVKLMYSGSVTVLGDVFSLGDGYERKEFIHFIDLLDVISKIVDDINEDNQSVVLKSITDAVSDLNKRSVKELGYHLFEIQNEGLNWNL